jgi:Ca-activated chloride channel family protein
MFRLAEINWLFAWLGLLLFPAAWWWMDRQALGRLQALVGAHLAESLTAENSPRRKWLGRLCLLLAAAVLILGMARPQIGLTGESEAWSGTEIEILIDTSRSMMANDVIPNRLARAKQALHYLADHLEGQRVGLIPYAGTAFDLCPLTQDTGALKLLIDALDVQQLPVPGTDIGAALEQAIKAFERVSKNENAHRICLVIGDGENFGNLPRENLKKAVENGLRIYTIGVGTIKGAPVPPRDAILNDEKSGAPITRINEHNLGELAVMGQGLYVRLTETGMEEDLVLKDIERLEKFKKYSNRLLIWDDLYPWCTGAAALLLVLDFLLSRRRRAWPWKKLWPRTQALGLGVMFVWLALGFAVPAHAGTRQKTQAGLQAYKQHRWADAERFFKQAAQSDPENPLGTYNYGCSLLMQKKLNEAYQAFVQAKSGARGELAKNVWYNTGYTAYHLGWLQGDSARWVEAAEAFQQVLLWNPEDEDASYNLELILRQIEQHTKKTTQRQTQSQGGKKGEREGGGANLPGSDRTPSEGRQNNQAPSAEQNSPKNERQKSGDRSSVSEDQKGNKQKGMSKQDALRTLRSLENDEQDMQRNRQPNLNDENLYRGPDY